MSNKLLILADKHHEALTKSLKILFKKRLGHKLFFPFGREWFDEGYWLIARPYNDFPGTINQYLVAPNGDRGISFDDFIKGDFDVVIASYIEHARAYYKMINKYNLKAKLIVQMGNEWEVDWNITNNLLSSTKKFDVPSKKNVVFYHQEFDTNLFKFDIYVDGITAHARSFVHCMTDEGLHKQDWKDFQELEKQLPELKFESYGISCREGTVQKQIDVASKMKDSKFGVHFKEGGDGYGHTIFNWFAVGRPVIYKGSQYKGKLAGELLVDGKTGFDFEKGNIVQRIQRLTDKRYHKMCMNTYKKFVEKVNFEQEAEDIKQFLKDLI